MWVPDLNELSRWWALYAPIGAVGAWRWLTWLIKKVYASRYRPAVGSWEAAVAVVTPVYNENPDVFRQALESWKANGVAEIIAVIDHTDAPCIQAFQQFSAAFSGARLIVTKVPGKRSALVAGIRGATCEIVALVDSDTIWENDVRRQALIPFADARIGGVATRQSVLTPRTLAQRIFNAQLNLRYFEELPFMTAAGGTVITCLSGRTAFYRRVAIMPLLDDLLHETFWGRPVISGDDKRLTYLLEAAGWRAAFQQTAHVRTPGMPTMRAFLKQRLRWTRNSWRADLRTLTQPWVYRHPRFVWYLFDRVLQPFAVLLAPAYLIVSMLFGLWLPIIILVSWWHVGRGIRLYLHFRRHPRDIILLPLLVGLNLYFALMKIYALLTLNRQGWITRWDANRLPSAPRLAAAVIPYVVMAGLLVALTGGIAWREVSRRPLLATAPSPTALPPSPLVAKPLERYVIQPGDTLEAIARQSNTTLDHLLAYNAPWLPSQEHLEVGLVLTLPPAHPDSFPTDYVSSYGRLGPRRIVYDLATNTIEVSGRGQQIRLSDIQRAVGSEVLHETTPRQWLLTASLRLKAGVVLILDKHEVTTLKLMSTPDGFATITAISGQISIDGVSITSWDPAQQAPDTTMADGRSYILVSGHGRLDIVDADLGYLGFRLTPDGRSGTSGVSWKSAPASGGRSLITGVVRNSRFHHNYDGAYALGATGIQWIGNEFTSNVHQDYLQK